MAVYYKDKDGTIKKKEEKKKNYVYRRNSDGSITKKESGDVSWFKKGALADGYQFGDVTKTILGTRKDTKENLYTGVIGIAESAIDAGATLLGGAGKLVGADDFQESMRRFVEKDLIDEKKVARTMDTITGGIPSWVSALNNKYGADEASVFGDKADGLLQSAGQLAGTAALQSVGVPWYVTTGATSFGGQAEEAFKEGATYGQAVGSALISAGAEILTEKLSGGISFGGKTLDDVLLKPLTEKISSKAVKALVNLGMDAVGEGAEEVITSVISNLGTALYKEESIEELLASEEAIDEYIQSFIGGAVLGGGMNVGKAAKSIATGRDYNTGLTENEQAVIDKEVENRIKEREETGEKISKSEKASIEEQVKSDLAKGYIGIDTIESVLGGDDYKAYKDVSDREDALVKEFEELGKKQNATLAEQARYAKLEQQIEELKGSSEKSKLKEQLSQRVSELAKSDRLAESYNEKTRRSQAYTADLTKYGEKQKAVVKAAAESGILNNTNRTHEFVDMIAKIAADKGVSFDFTNNQKLKDSGFALEGKTVNGFLKDGNISLNIESAKALNTVVGHEITHVLEGTELYGELQQAVKMYAESKGEYGKRLEALQKLYEGVEGANIENELTADLIGDYLFTDSDFVNRLSTEKPGLFKRIFEEIKYLLKTATAGSKQARELEKVKRTFEKAYKEDGKSNVGTKYSMSEDANLYQYVEDALEGKLPKKSFYKISNVISDRMAKDIEKIVGFSVEGYGNEISPGNIRHIEKEHGAKGRADHSMQDHHDLAKIAYVVENYDKIREGKRSEEYRNSDRSFAKTVELQKKIDDGFYYVVEAVPDANIKTLHITSAYINKKDTFSEELVSNDPKRYVQDEHQPNVSSTNSIPQNEEKASGKQIYSMSDSTGRQLSEEQREYFKDSKVRDENGALKPVYHGTNKEFSRFESVDGTYWFSEDVDYAEAMAEERSGSRIIEVYLDIKNPYMTKLPPNQFSDPNSEKSIIRYAKANGYDGVIIENDTDVELEKETFYVAFEQAQIKAVDNHNPTEKQDINLSLSETSVDIGPIGNNVYGKDIALEEIAPVQQNIPNTEENAPVGQEYSPDELPTWEGVKSKPLTRSDLHQNIMENIEAAFSEKGYNLEDVLSNAKNLATFRTVDNTPQRVMEKALGYKEGQILSDLTVNKVAQNETEGIRWLNSFTDRKNGFLKQISKKYGIKSGSKESAAAQMYAEGFYVNDKNEIVAYGDAELAADFPDAKVRENIKGLAEDPRIRQIYDETLKMINESRTRNAYPEIPRLENYFLHFRAMDDTFSRLGLPFNPRDIRAKDLPTDLNGVTADLKPGKPYFASEQHRKGKRTSFDLLGGLERYLTSAKNQIFHIDDIQTLRALRNYVVNRYGQASGLENLDILTEEEAQERISQVYGSHLSTFAKFLNEEANIIAGKTALIDRGLEGIIGRRGITALNEINRQVGANMVGFNISSAGTNFLAAVQALAKTKKAAFVKALAQTTADKASRVFGGEGDGFGEKSPVMIRRKGAERFYRTPYQMVGDWGYALMGAVDNITTEVIARAKYNEFTAGGMDADTAHYETDKWVSRLMGDRSLGQMPQLYNSRMLGLVTKFQLEVRNQLDSQFYDTIQEANVSTEEIENKLLRNAKKAAKIGSTFFQLAVMQHLFGKAYESVAGYNPAFDIVEAIIKMFGWDDEEDSEDTALDNIEEGFLSLLEDMPYSSLIMDGGRIPISSALPIGQLVSGEDDYGNEKSRLETLGEALPYYVLPGGYGQIKKSYQGLKMFDDDLPIAGSYTDSGNLRFAVEDTFANRVQAGIFGQWANENARDYFDNERDTLKEKQIQELVDTGLPMADYWKYRDGLKEQSGTQEKIEYIAGLDLPIDMKNIMVNNAVQRETPIDLTEYDNLSGYEEFDFFTKNKELYTFLQENGVSYWDYKVLGEDVQKKYKALLKDTDKQRFLKENGVSASTYCGFNEAEKEAYDWAYKNPEKYQLSQVITKDVVEYKRILSVINAIPSDKDENGKTIKNSQKKKVERYINNLNIDYGQKLILFRSLYEPDDTYNYEIVEYLNGRDDISRKEMESILESLGFMVYPDGTVKW